MFLVGRTAWLQNGDPFAVAFGILARFAPMEIRTGARLCPCPGGEGGDGGENCMNCSDCFDRAPPAEREWNLRPVGVGLLRTSDITPSMVVFVLLMLSAVTFDGFTATPLWATVENALYHALPGPGATRLAVIGTAGLALFAVAFMVVYRFFAWWMAVAAGGELAAATTARLFVLSLVPIAIAYHLAHYFTYLLIQGQLIIRLGPDPLGFGWNLLGTAHYRPDIDVVGARFAWYSAVIAIVLGHVIAVAVAHIVALREYATRRAALRSQLPMLVLMVGYTMVSLWIIAQPIVEARPDAAVAPASFIGAADDAGDLARSLARRRMRHESLGAGCDPRGRRVSARRGGANRRAPDGPGQPLCARRGLLAAARGGKRTAPGDRGGNRHRRRRRSDAGQSAVASGAAGWQGLLAAGLDPARRPQRGRPAGKDVRRAAEALRLSHRGGRRGAARQFRACSKKSAVAGVAGHRANNQSISIGRRVSVPVVAIPFVVAVVIALQHQFLDALAGIDFAQVQGRFRVQAADMHPVEEAGVAAIVP